MTTSPYDNLPTGKTEDADAQPLHYVDVEIEDIPEPAPPLQAEAKPAEDIPAAQPLQAAMPAQTSKPAPAMHPVQTTPAMHPVQTTSAMHPVQTTPAMHPVQPARDQTKTTPFEKAPQYSNVTIRNMRSMNEYTLPFEESLLVPDTMPDMERLLFAEGSVRPAQPEKQSYGKDDFLSGDITVYAVYQPVKPSGPVDVVKSVIPFKTDKCWGDGAGSSFKAEITVKAITAEMVNERKFIVRGQLLIRTTEIAPASLKVFQGAEDAELVRAAGSITVTDLDFEMEGSVDISQDININESQPSPIKILKESIRIVENHRQITSGKLVINATIHSQVLYMGEEDGERQLGCMTNKTDFTQFLLVKKDVDPALIKISFSADDLSITIENQNMFLLQGTVTAFLCGYASKSIDMTADAYHKSRDIAFDVSAQNLSAVKDVTSGEISAREVISIEETGQKPEMLLCGSVQMPSVEARIERGRVIVEGAMPVTILALDEEEMPFIIEASLPLRGSLDTAAGSGSLPVAGSGKAPSASLPAAGSGKAPGASLPAAGRGSLSVAGRGSLSAAGSGKAPGASVSAAGSGKAPGASVSAAGSGKVPGASVSDGAPSSGGSLTACASAILKDFWFDEINSRQLEINVSVAIKVWIYGEETFYTLENLCFADDGKPERRISMAVYVTGPNDTLWDVAKHYKCDTDTIAGLNQLDPQRPLAQGMKLFIAR